MTVPSNDGGTDRVISQGDTLQTHAGDLGMVMEIAKDHNRRGAIYLAVAWLYDFAKTREELPALQLQQPDWSWVLTTNMEVQPLTAFTKEVVSIIHRTGVATDLLLKPKDPQDPWRDASVYKNARARGPHCAIANVLRRVSHTHLSLPHYYDH
jgi:hypothetical protein